MNIHEQDSSFLFIDYLHSDNIPKAGTVITLSAAAFILPSSGNHHLI